jgi:transcription antitermination factor NusG
LEKSTRKGGEALPVADTRATSLRQSDPRTGQTLHASGESWYAVWTQSHCERLVAAQLSAKGFRSFLPEMQTWSKRVGSMHLIRVPMFPGYLFVRHAMHKSSYVEMLKVRGLVRILENGWTRLTPIPEAEIDAIHRISQANVPVLPHAHLRHGDRVEVLEGPLSGLRGIFVHDKPAKGRLVVSVNLLGRSVAVEVDCVAVSACAA